MKRRAARPIQPLALSHTLGPQGIHVAIVIVDGTVDKPGIEAFTKGKPTEALIDPAAVAETVYSLTTQSPCGWSFEVEVRPALENW